MLTRLTLADFSSPEEFQRWKMWSDESYRQIENAGIAFSKHTLSLSSLSEKATTTQSPEDTLMETLEQQEREKMRCLDLHAHQFRHAKATHWLEDGVNIVQISFLLGHEQLDTTMRYLDITTEQEIAALSTLEEERHKNIRPKWNSEKDSLSTICNLRRLKK